MCARAGGELVGMDLMVSVQTIGKEVYLQML
jgi:hypothetical protein